MEIFKKMLKENQEAITTGKSLEREGDHILAIPRSSLSSIDPLDLILFTEQISGHRELLAKRRLIIIDDVSDSPSVTVIPPLFQDNDNYIMDNLNQILRESTNNENLSVVLDNDEEASES